MCELVFRVLVRFLLKQKSTILVHKNGWLVDGYEQRVHDLRLSFHSNQKEPKYPKNALNS